MRRTSKIKWLSRLRKRRILQKLSNLSSYLADHPNENPQETNEYLQRRIHEIVKCGAFFGNQAGLCGSICLCERCIYVKKNEYLKRIKQYLKQNGPLYLFIRKERFVDKSLTFEDLEQRVRYLERQRGKINRSMFLGIAQLDGVIHRVEVLPDKDNIVTCLTSLFFSSKPKVRSEADCWEKYHIYRDHEDHRAYRRRYGYIHDSKQFPVINNTKRMRSVLNKIFKAKTDLYASMENKDLISMLLLMKRRHSWTSGGPLFQQEK